MNIPVRDAQIRPRPLAVAAEIERRRTFAIISHPDAGKTTLTEKLLLYGGAIHLAGPSRQSESAQPTSDWMAIEKQRGISMVTSVMTFDYLGKVRSTSSTLLATRTSPKTHTAR